MGSDAAGNRSTLSLREHQSPVCKDSGCGCHVKGILTCLQQSHLCSSGLSGSRITALCRAARAASCCSAACAALLLAPFPGE